MQEASTMLLFFSVVVFVMSVLLVSMKRTRSNAILLFAGSSLLLAATTCLKVFHSIGDYLLFNCLGGALIFASAILGLFRNYKSSRTRSI